MGRGEWELETLTGIPDLNADTFLDDEFFRSNGHKHRFFPYGHNRIGYNPTGPNRFTQLAPSDCDIAVMFCCTKVLAFFSLRNEERRGGEGERKRREKGRKRGRRGDSQGRGAQYLIITFQGWNTKYLTKRAHQNTLHIRHY